MDGLAGAGVFEREVWCLLAGFQDAIFDAGIEEVLGGSFGDGKALRLHEGASVLGDAVELILQRCFQRSGHDSIISLSPSLLGCRSLRRDRTSQGLRISSRLPFCWARRCWPWASSSSL